MSSAIHKPLGPELWCIALPEEEATSPDLERVLSLSQRLKIQKFVHPADRHSRVVAHALLRLRAGEILRQSPAEITMLAAPHGKPKLNDGSLDSNLSHCRTMVCAAFLAQGSVGVDVEPLSGFAAEDLQAMIQAVLLPEEADALYRHPGPVHQSFLLWWTLKEAIVKARGDGLTRSLQTFAVHGVGTQPSVTFSAPDDPYARFSWHLQQWIHGGHVVALAWCSPIRGQVAMHSLSLSALRATARSGGRLLDADVGLP